MTKKKKFLSIFTILFALVFALALVFGAACGKKNKDDSNDNDPEITEPDDDGKGDDGSGSGSGEGGDSGSTGSEGEDTGSGSGSGEGGDGSGSGSGSGTVEIPEGATNVYSFEIDFSDENSYAWIATPTDHGEDGSYAEVGKADYTNGLVTYVAVGSSTIGKESAGALYTSSDKNSYFAINLDGLEGDYIEIETSMCGNANKADNNTDRMLAVATSNEAPVAGANTVLDSVTSKNKEEVEDLDYVGIVADDTLYLTWNNNIQIFSIEINLYGDKVPDLDIETPDVVEAKVDNSVMSFTSTVGSANANASYTVNGGADAENAYSEAVESSDASVATATLSNGVITVRPAGTGTAYVTYSVSDGDGEVVASAEIYVAVDTSLTAYDETAGIYTTEYLAVAGAGSTGAFIALGTQADGVAFANNCTTFKTSKKSTEDSSVTYSDYAETKSNKYITITVPEGATASITAYVSHTDKSTTRQAYLGTDVTKTGEDEYIDAVDIVNIDSKSPAILYELQGTNLEAGTYYVYGGSDTVHTYAVIVTYTYETAEPAIMGVAFDTTDYLLGANDTWSANPSFPTLAKKSSQN